MVEKHRKHCNILYYITVENLIRFIWYFRMHRLFDTSCFVFRFFRKTTCVRFGKAGAHPQLAWESQLPLKPCLSLQPFDFEGNCDSSDSLLDFCFFSSCSLICFANVGCSPTPRQHFWKTAAPKNFSVACGSYPATTSHLFISPAFPCFCETVNNIVHYLILYAV